MQTPPLDERPRRRSWYSQPVVWLGAAVFAASVAGSLWLIVLSARHDGDARVPSGRQVFGVPAHSAPPSSAR